MEKKKKRLLSGVKPTGRFHLGNYFGAVEQFVSLQKSYESYIFIPNYHAITTLHDREQLQTLTRNALLDYLAVGLDPEQVVFFLQSDVPAHTELAWIFNCITTVPYLQRAHAYKDAVARGDEVSVGTFTYPLLMAADILLYSPDIVPVGKDQKQHVEYARDTAEKFNRLFGETFVLPEAHIVSSQESIPGVDGRKMSKSYQNTIPLFGTEEEMKKAVFSIVTDSKQPEEPKDPEGDTLFTLLSLFSSDEEKRELESMYRDGGTGYKELKELLHQKIQTLTAPMRERRAEYEAHPNQLDDILESGKQKAMQVAGEKLQEVKERVGVL